MACETAGCGTGCCKDEDGEKVNGEEKVVVLEGCRGGSISNGTKDPCLLDGDNLRRLCFKCKVEESLSFSPGVDGSIKNFCLSCFRASLFGKFKHAITTHDMISATDNVLVAFSGGPSSRVALQFVHELQQKAQRNLDASRDKCYPVFGVGVAIIDDSSVSADPSYDQDKAFQDLRLIVSSLAPPEKQLHIMPIGSICSSDSKDNSNRVKELLHSVTDETGKEDLLQHLRMLSLHKIALDNGYTKLVLGSCTSRIACHIISATVKGQGYSLPAYIQYLDSRWEIPVVLPLRDCVAQEVNMLCRLDGLKTLELLDGPRSGINGLVSSFIAVLQEENPSRERTIVRTAEKLSPFHFNRLPLPAANGSNNHLPNRWRRRKPNQQKSDVSIMSEFLCPICCSPLNKSDLESLRKKLENCKSSIELFGSSCCPSCQFQILPKEPSSMKQFHSLLPQPMVARATDCHINGDQAWLSLKTLELLDGPRSGINGLVSSFITVLQEQNPPHERTIVRTTLQHKSLVHFIIIGYHYQQPMVLTIICQIDGVAGSQIIRNLMNSFCQSFSAQCSPLNKSYLESLRRSLRIVKPALSYLNPAVCPSCQFQILPKDPTSMKQFHSLLTQPMLARTKDCHISGVNYLC